MSPRAETGPAYSVSSLMVYESCPLQYYMTAVLKLPPPVSRGMRRGTSVHKLVADHLRGKAPLVPPDEPDVARLYESFTASRFNRTPVAIEKPFRLEMQGGLVRGRMDVVFPRGERGLEVVDFKSGMGQGRQGLGGGLQLPLYAVAVAQLYERKPEDVSYTYYFLGDGAEASFRSSGEKATAVTERVEEIIARIQAGEFDPTPGCQCFACERLRAGRLRLPGR